MSLQIEDIAGLMEPIIKAYRAAKDITEVDLGAVYAKSVTDAHEIKVHEDGLFPDHIIQGRAPNETQAEFDYRKNSYQSETQYAWHKIRKSISGIWAQTELTVEDDYFTEYPGYEGSFLDYMREIVTPERANQPMAVAYVSPKMIPTTEEGDPDDSEKVDPVVKISETANSIRLTDEYAILLSPQRSVIETSSGKKKEGLIFVILDDENEWHYIQTSSTGGKWLFDVELFYRHNLQHIPAYRLGGDRKRIGDEVLFKSVFSAALPHLNKAAFETSNADALIAKVCYPTRVYYDQDCDECEGKGYLDDKNSECPVCHGSGKEFNFSPLKDYTHRPAERLDGDTAAPTFPGLTYVSPDSAPLDKLDQRNKDHILKAGLAVNVDLTVKTDPGNKDTATAKRIDLQERRKVDMDYEKAMRRLTEQLVTDIIDMRYVTEAKPEVKFTGTSDFGVKDSEMLIVEIEQITDSSLPQNITQQAISDYTKARYSNNERKMRLLEIREFADPLHGIDDERATSEAKMMGLPWVGILHRFFDAFVLQLEAEQQGFIEQDLPAIQQALEAKAKAMTPSNGTAQAILDS